MLQLNTDNFVRADENPLSGSGNWKGPTGAAFRIVSNLAQPVSLAQDEWSVYTSRNWPNNQYSQANIKTTGGTSAGGQGTGVCVRADHLTKTGYCAVVNDAATSNIEVSKYVAGTKTSLGFVTTAWIDGDTLRMEVEGRSPSVIKLYRNNNLLGSSFTDAVGLRVGSPGLFYVATATTSGYYDWRGGGDYTSASLQLDWCRSY